MLSGSFDVTAVTGVFVRQDDRWGVAKIATKRSIPSSEVLTSKYDRAAVLRPEFRIFWKDLKRKDSI